MIWPTAQPRAKSSRRAQRVFCAPSADARWYDTHVGHVPQKPNTRTVNFRSPHRQPVAQSVRLSLGRRRGEERAALWPTPQPRAKFALRGVCPTRRRPILNGAICARDVRHRNRHTDDGLSKPRRRPVAQSVRSSLSPTACGGFCSFRRRRRSRRRARRLRRALLVVGAAATLVVCVARGGGAGRGHIRSCTTRWCAPLSLARPGVVSPPSRTARELMPPPSSPPREN